jgi:hypothetical protein
MPKESYSMHGDDAQRLHATGAPSTTSIDDEFGPAPEGGSRAWIVAAGGGAIFFSTLGFANSFGTFEEYYLSHQLKDWSASDISWIGSLAIFLQFFAGMLSGPLFDRYGEKVSRY